MKQRDSAAAASPRSRTLPDSLLRYRDSEPLSWYLWPLVPILVAAAVVIALIFE